MILELSRSFFIANKQHNNISHSGLNIIDKNNGKMSVATRTTFGALREANRRRNYNNNKLAPNWLRRAEDDDQRCRFQRHFKASAVAPAAGRRRRRFLAVCCRRRRRRDESGSLAALDKRTRERTACLHSCVYLIYSFVRLPLDARKPFRAKGNNNNK